MQSDSSESPEQKTVIKVTKEKPTRKNLPVKSVKHPKPKRSSFLIRKFKFKSKSTIATSSPQKQQKKEEQEEETEVAEEEEEEEEGEEEEGGRTEDLETSDLSSIPGPSSLETHKSENAVSQKHYIPIVDTLNVTTEAEIISQSEEAAAAGSVAEEISTIETEEEENTRTRTNFDCTQLLDITTENMPPYGDLIIAEDPSLPSTSRAALSSLSSTSLPPTSHANNPPVEQRKDHLYKIIVIGDLGCGKTSIIKRYVHRFFTQHYRATVGVDFALKVLNWDDNTLIRLQLWDIAGQERYGNMTRVYYKEAVGAFIVFDVTRTSTFESVSKWKSDLDSKVLLGDGNPIPCVLLANKCDQPKEGLVTNPNKMDEYVREHGFLAWFETSAKDNINIDDAAKALVTRILELDVLNSESSRDSGNGEKLTLANDGNSQRNSKTCSC